MEEKENISEKKSKNQNLEEIRTSTQKKSTTKNLVTNVNPEKKMICIQRFGNKIIELSISTKKKFDEEIKKYLLFPIYRENGNNIPLRSFSQLKKIKENPIILEEGIDLTNFDKAKFANLIYYLGRDAPLGDYLYQYNFLTLNYSLYFSFLTKDKIFNKVYNNGTIFSLIDDENCSKFEVLVRKYFLYGTKIYKFFLGPSKIGKTSLIHQIIHHNYLHEMEYPYEGYCYFDLSLLYNKQLTIEDINRFFYDSYFLFFSHNEYLSFINDYSQYLNSDILSNIFKIIEKLALYIFGKYKETKVSITIILDGIRKEMKNDIYDLINFCEKSCKNKNTSESKIKLLFSGNLNFGQIYSEKITDLINSNSNLDEYSKYHIIFDNAYKIPKNALIPSKQNILDNLNFELSSYHEYYDIINDDYFDDYTKLNLIKQKIKNDLLNYEYSYLCLNKLLVEKCKNNKNILNENEIRYMLDINQENNILENLPWSYFRITKNNNNKTGYNINYRDNISKQVIEEIIDEYYTEKIFSEYEKNKPNNIFGFFFEQFLVNNFKNSKKFLNYIIDDILIINSIYTNNDWEFIKYCKISSNKCYLIIQNLINAPYYDLAVLIPKGENFIILLIQITVKKSNDKRELLKPEYNFQRFNKIKTSFENSFKDLKLVDGDFSYIIFEERDKNTIEFCINNCIKCISYYKEGIFKYWKDDLNSIIIDKYPIDEFSILNSINNKELTLRKNKIQKLNEKRLLNLYNINPKTKKVKPIVKLSKKEIDIIKFKIKEIVNDNNIYKISLNFIENESDINIEPLENEIIVFLKNNQSKITKIGYGLKFNDEIKYYNFLNEMEVNKFDACFCQRYKFIYYNKLIGNKRSNTK